jgi:hypothetical protein
MGHDGTVRERARENLSRIGRGEDIPPRLRDSMAPEKRKPTPQPTPEYGENKRKKQIRQQEEAADSPDAMGNDGEPDKMKMTMDEFKSGTLHSGSKTGPKVKNRKQAIAIGLSQARKAGQKK